MAGTDAPEQIVQRIALAHLQRIEALVGDRACRLSCLIGSVRAVIREDVDIDKLRRIILRFEAGDEFADHMLFIAGADENGISAMGGFDRAGQRALRRRATNQTIKRIVDLIQINQKEQQSDGCID